jgi:hypothetical protein
MTMVGKRLLRVLADEARYAVMLSKVAIISDPGRVRFRQQRFRGFHAQMTCPAVPKIKISRDSREEHIGRGVRRRYSWTSNRE